MRPHHIRALSNNELSPFEFTPAMCNIDDIARGLQQVRWMGQTRRPLTINEHSVRISVQVEHDYRGEDRDRKRVALVGLLHDAHEFVLMDLPSPFKNHPAYAFYGALADKVQEAIWAWAGVTPDDLVLAYPHVKVADLRMLLTEHRALREDVESPDVPDDIRSYGGDLEAAIRHGANAPSYWSAEFRQTFRRLTRPEAL
jgi:hypothetical protein